MKLLFSKRPRALLLHRAQLPSRSRVAFKPSLLIACALALGLSAFGQGYEANDLTPIGAGSGKFTGGSGGKHVGASQPPLSSYMHAMRLNDNALVAEDLHPAGYYYSIATCADDSQEGGWGYSNLGLVHALVWTGSTCTDLNPSGYNSSYCLGVHNGEQVGYAQTQSYFVTGSHAYSWHGSAGSGVDLHPAPYLYSRATACHDGEEVGYVSSLAYPEGESLGYHDTSRAHRWSGTAASAVDLHPASFDASEALATSGTQQGGWGYIATGTSRLHALLWSGTAQSVVDLHPAGYTESRITAMTATMQVGEGWVGTPGAAGAVRHALAWSGTAESVVDLNQYLPKGYTHAVATGVDSDGNVVGYAYNNFVSGMNIPPGAIAVVFAPGQTPPGELASVALNASQAAPGDVLQGLVTLGGPAPAGGLNISFASSNAELAAAPDPIVVPEGETQVPFSLPTGGATLAVPTTFKVFATDGVVSHVAQLNLIPVVKPSTFTVNPVEGGFNTFGSLALNIPAQAGGATFTLSSGNPSLVSIPASVTIPQGYTSWTFSANTAPVSTTTSVPITATLNGQTLTTSLTVEPAPVVALASLNIPEMVGGQTVTGTVSVNNFPRNAGGAVISLSSGDSSALQVPATVTIPQGSFNTTFQVTTSVVEAIKGAVVTAAYNGGSLSTTAMVNPIPTVTITQADYMTDTHMLKVSATTSYANSILTYGTTATAAPIGTMQFEQGIFKGSIILDTAPAFATVWNSNGGQATMAVTIKTPSTGGGGGGGGGGSSTSTASYRLVVKTAGKGSVTTSPAGSNFPAGTVVTLTANPASGSTWNGWSGDASGSSRTISVTIKKDTTLTANFK